MNQTLSTINVYTELFRGLLYKHYAGIVTIYIRDIKLKSYRFKKRLNNDNIINCFTIPN